MTETKKSKRFDLEERTFAFAQRINIYVNELPKSMPNIENGKQLIRAGGSVGANYIEANESLSKKDFVMRVKICRKEAKECRYWIRLTVPHDSQKNERDMLFQEATELMKIFGAILEKSK